jgi:cytochrome c-type biogenesis protein
VFGVSYAIASIGCTLPVFLGPVAGTFSRDSFLDGVLVFAVYGLGMALVLLALTVGIALARTSIVHGLRRAQPYIGRVAGGLVALAGAYVAYYGWHEVRIARQGTVPDAPITDVVAGWSYTARDWITDVGAVRIAVVVTILVAGVIAAVRYGRTGTFGNPRPRTPADTGPDRVARQ